MEYILKPVHVKALQFTGSNKEEFVKFLNELKITPFNYMPDCLNIVTFNGVANETLAAKFTDYVVRFENNTFQVFTEEDFNNTFDKKETNGN
jgi:hypothetical protein